MSHYDTPEARILVTLIKSSPNATVMMDNDCWYMMEDGCGEDDEALASGDLTTLWGALALIAGIKMEPV